MEYRYLGKSGLQVSAITLGGNVFGRVVDTAGTATLVNHALDQGINMIDTADTYTLGASEELLGKALKSRRHEAIIATKGVGPMGEGPNMRQASRQHLSDALDDSLRRLQTDYIDLYQMHSWDRDTPLEETMRALDDFVRQGKVRYVGANGYKAWHIAEAHWLAQEHHWAPMISEQPEFSLLERGIEREVIPACQRYGVGIIPHYVIAGGLLTGKYKRGEPLPSDSRFGKFMASPRATGRDSVQIGQRWNNERYWTLLETLDAFAEERGHSVGELAIAWVLAQPMISSAIVAATKPEQIDANVQAVEWKLTKEELTELDELTK